MNESQQQVDSSHILAAVLDSEWNGLAEST